MSRPSKFTEALAARICDELADGKSLRGICGAADMPDRSTVLRWLAADDGFAAKYARAREAQADALEEGMAEIEDDVLAGRLDPQSAKVVLGSRQWRAMKLAPKKYGEKVQVGGADDLPPVKTEGSVTLEPSEAYKRMLGG